MKASLVVLTFLAIATSVSAKEAMVFEEGRTPSFAYVNPDYKAGGENLASNEKDMKIATLNKLLDQQQRLYDEKISYLENELQKTKDRLIEKSILNDKMQAETDKKFTEESGYLKKELVAKTKTVMEYQRQLEKVKPDEEMKNLIKVNTELALEVRRTSDQLAIIQLKGDEVVKPGQERNNLRMPASVK